MIMNDAPEEEQETAAFEEAEYVPEATFAINGQSPTPPLLTRRTSMGHRPPRLLDPLLRQTRPRRRSSSCSPNRPLLAVLPPPNPLKLTSRSDGPQPHKLNILFPKRVQIRVSPHFP